MEITVLLKGKVARYIKKSQPATQPLFLLHLALINLNGIFLLGDAAGSITPLCGNGMSMGMRASKLLATELIDFFKNKQLRKEVIANYRSSWNHVFNRRITAGYYLQNLFGKRNTTDYSLRILSKFPLMTNKLISLTHGERF